MVLSTGSALGLYSEKFQESSKLSEAERVQLKESCRELGQVLEMAVEDDSEEMARNELDCA
jgi:hypothetical protein